MLDYRQTYLKNSGWFHLEVHWTTPGGEVRRAGLEGLEMGEMVFESDKNYTDVYVTGPGGTRWEIELGQGHTYVWHGPIWNQQVRID